MGGGPVPFVAHIRIANTYAPVGDGIFRAIDANLLQGKNSLLVNKIIISCPAVIVC
jgi:hypothetical protein